MKGHWGIFGGGVVVGIILGVVGARHDGMTFEGVFNLSDALGILGAVVVALAIPPALQRLQDKRQSWIDGVMRDGERLYEVLDDVQDAIAGSMDTPMSLEVCRDQMKAIKHLLRQVQNAADRAGRVGEARCTVEAAAVVSAIQSLREAFSAGRFPVEGFRATKEVTLATDRASRAVRQAWLHLQRHLIEH